MDADLIEADLREADLRDVNLKDANLRGADLMGADLTKASLDGVDLRWAINLNRCGCEQVSDWTGCKILLRDRDNLGLDDPDAHSIIWCDDETGDPIEF